MCEYQTFKNGLVPMCTVINDLCSFCVIGNHEIYDNAKKKEETERANTSRLKPCPYCKDSWLYVSDGGYTSGYESKGYRVECQCGFAWKSMGWQKTEKEAIKKWNGMEVHDK